MSIFRGYKIWRKGGETMNKKKGKSKYALVLVLFLLVGITIGYAALETALNIKGTSSIGENSTWDVHFENAEVTANNTVLQEAPAIDTAKTKV